MRSKIRFGSPVLSALLIPASVALASCVSSPVEQVDWHVIDGDTVRAGTQRHRLHGIDAPEIDQQCQRSNGSVWSCGKESSKYLAGLLKRNNLQCFWNDQDQYGRYLSTCYVEGLNVNAEMVKQGYALAYVRYSTEYVEKQHQARASGVGLWQGDFVRPWDYRRLRTSMDTTTYPTARIKGNISRKGKRYYHCPEDPMYSRTRISEQRGERWFVDSNAAKAAGWEAVPGGGLC